GAEHYAHPNIARHRCDASQGVTILQPHDAAVCFEAIEHLRDPRPMLRELRRLAGVLLCSVPNETGFPWRPGYRHHHRHYTAGELEALLRECGWTVTGWLHQDGPDSEVSDDDSPIHPRTLLAVCERADAEVIPIAGAAAADPVPVGLPEMQRVWPAID